MWTQLVSKRAGEDEGSTTWIDLSKAYAINISADNATIYIGGETYTTNDEKDLEHIQSWLLRKKQSQSS